jgi:putative transposon-encoded protein
MTEKMIIKIPAYQVMDKLVKPFGNTCHVILPKDWQGKKVSVLLLEELD